MVVDTKLSQIAMYKDPAARPPLIYQPSVLAAACWACGAGGEVSGVKQVPAGDWSWRLVPGKTYQLEQGENIMSSNWRPGDNSHIDLGDILEIVGSHILRNPEKYFFICRKT